MNALLDFLMLWFITTIVAHIILAGCALVLTVAFFENYFKKLYLAYKSEKFMILRIIIVCSFMVTLSFLTGL